MKICMISDLYWPDIIGGTETYLRLISERLSINNNVTVICTRHGNERDELEELNRVKVYRINTGNIYSIFDCAIKPFYLKPFWHLRSLSSRQSYFGVKEILKKERPDIVHTHNLKALSPLIFDAIQELKIPHVHELHDYGLFCPRNNLLHGSGKICENPNIMCKFYRSLKRWMVDDKPQLVIGPSKFVIDKHLECGFFGNTKYQQLPHGVKVPDKKFNKDFNFIDILYVGQLSKHKGVHILIEAFKKIQREDICLHICGKGKNEEEYRSLARDDNRIIFYGFVSERKLNNLYDIANILVVPSIWYDNSPTVIYEAFVHRTPVIGSKIGGITELINDSENGYLYEPGNEDQLIKIIETLSPSKLVYLEENISRQMEEYTIDTYIKKLEPLYNRLLRARWREHETKCYRNISSQTLVSGAISFNHECTRARNGLN